MALNKLKFNSINVTPAANQALKFNSSADGFETGSAGGAMKFIKKLTASSSSTLSFVDGASDVVLDNTYKEYLFILNNIHPADVSEVQFNLSADSGSNYNVTKTTTFFRPTHRENGADGGIAYRTPSDLAQGTGFQSLTQALGDTAVDNDASASGYLHLFNPSSTTFVKHFIAEVQHMHNNDYSMDTFVAGYGNTTSAIDAVQFKVSSGNIDSGTITLYGIN
jgi:hypothetical protein